MSDRESLSRREVVSGLALAGLVGLQGIRSEPVAAEPPPETTTLRFGGHVGAVCAAQGFLAEELLAAEGFTEVQYVKVGSVPEITKVMAAGETDFGIQTVLPAVMRLDAGDPLVLLASAHIGCYELFGTDLAD